MTASLTSSIASLKMSRSDKFDVGRSPPAGFSSSYMRSVGRMQAFRTAQSQSTPVHNSSRRASRVLMIDVASNCFTETDISSELESL